MCHGLQVSRYHRKRAAGEPLRMSGCLKLRRQQAGYVEAFSNPIRRHSTLGYPASSMGDRRATGYMVAWRGRQGLALRSERYRPAVASDASPAWCWPRTSLPSPCPVTSPAGSTSWPARSTRRPRPRAGTQPPT